MIWDGVKFQCILFRYPQADYEGVIGAENGLVGDKENSAPVYWATGAGKYQHVHQLYG